MPINSTDDNADAKRSLSTLPPEDWRRPWGCPRITWLSTIQQDLRSHNLTAWSNGYGPEPVSVEDVVDVRLYTILSCMPEMMMTTSTVFWAAHDCSSSKHHWQWALHLTPTDYSHILRRKTHIKATRINISNLQQAKHFWGPTSLVFSSTRTMLFFVIPSSRGTSLFFPFIFSYSKKMYTICLSTACQNNTII